MGDAKCRATAASRPFSNSRLLLWSRGPSADRRPRDDTFYNLPDRWIFPAPKMDIFINVLLAINLLVAVLMALVILMQRPKSEGLGAAFGGGVTENIFGAQTTNVLVKFTGWLAGIFFVLTFVLSVLYARHSSSDSALHKELMGMPTARRATASPAAATGSPAATAAPSVAASPAGNVSPTVTAKPSGVTAGVASSPSAAPGASP